MEQFKQFLDAIGTYWDILELEECVLLYQNMMINNKEDKEVYERLKITRDSYMQQKAIILGNKRIEGLKEEILSSWNLIHEYLLNNRKELDVLYTSKRGKRRLPIYAIIQEIVKQDITFFPIYQQLIQNNLYNPNLEYGVSDEPFFALLPTENLEQFYQINQSVISNPNTDFHILKNGSDIMEYAMFYLSESQNEMTKKYWEDYIWNAIKGSCSLLDAKRFHGVLPYEMEPTIFPIMHYPKLERIKDYILSEQGINKQIENAIFPSLVRNKAIDFYIEQIKDSGMHKKLLPLKMEKR